MKTKLKPFSIYVPITRLDEDQRIVEGIAFANEVVAGEGGIRLKRSAMEAATTDYVENGTVRAMHQPIAAGKPLSVEWTEKGAYLRAKIVDDQEWAKCKEGVYKGFSIGVVPQVMRGKDVEKCQWWDSSLVDIGKDKDAKFACLRVEGIDPEQEVEVELTRASFNEYLEGCAPSALRDMALDYLWNALWDIQYADGTPEEKEAAVRATCAEFTEFMVGAVATGILPQITDTAEDETNRAVGTPLLARMVELESEKDELLQRAEAATIQFAVQTETISTLTTERDNSAGELTRVQGLLDTEVTRAKAAEERVKQLESEPARRPPVRVPEALERTLAAQHAEDTAEVTKLQTELAELTRMTPATNQKEQDQRVGRISQIKRQLRTLDASA